jgi:hypothetical protein
MFRIPLQNWPFCDELPGSVYNDKLYPHLILILKMQNRYLAI